MNDSKKMIFTIIGSIIISFLTAKITTNYNLKKDLKLKNNEKKIIRYENMIKYLRIGFMIKNDATREEVVNNRNMFYEETYFAWLCASDDVVISIRNFIDKINEYYFNKNQEKSQQLFNEAERLFKIMILNMRRDVYNKSTEVQESDWRSCDVSIR